uniref:Uncharacterized protein n=1 Tax=Cajanus cajan TaxID=3821 RepID=A0A151RVU7_CAJCA|nr:hypothetical protein KK1_031753 [Cajanus cajan]
MKKGLSFVLLIILIHYYLIGTENCLIGNDLESEFSFGSHVDNILYDVSQSGIGNIANRNKIAVNCPSGASYRSCLPSKNGGGPNNRCGYYNRDC